MGVGGSILNFLTKARKFDLTALPGFWSSTMGMGIVLVLLSTSSCALLRIESQQKPLSINDLNTRLRTQAFVTEVMERTELAADSIAKLAPKDVQFQKYTLLWKIRTGEELKQIGFQTSPKVALTDVWAYMLEVHDLMSQTDSLPLLGPYQSIAIGTAAKNVEEIENIARSMLAEKDFERYREFVREYANEHPITSAQWDHQTVKPDFLKFRQVPDSLGVQTVGSLSEVVADVSNRVDFSSDILGKQMRWRTELWMKENGIDSIEFRSRINSFNAQLNRLLEVAEHSPETLEKAIADFVAGVDPLFGALNQELAMAMVSLSQDRAAVEKMVQRERIALDSLIKRERLAFIQEAKDIAETGIKNTMTEIRKTISSVLFYLLLLVIAVLGIPFYLGFLFGKSRNRKTKEK